MSDDRPPSEPSFVLDPLDLALMSEDPTATPQTSDHLLDESADGRVIRGIWEIAPGVAEDIEEDELFVVLSGRATVDLLSGQRLELRPGSVGILRRGERTRWTVHETLRKAYQITLS